MIINNNNFIKRINTNTQVGSNKNTANKTENNVNFKDVLKGKIDQTKEITFSKHAQMRLETRNINLTEAQKEKMKEAVSKAEQKGVRDSLVLMDNMAFVVSVKNRTVVTAANSDELKDNVFTNIDGAVIA